MPADFKTELRCWSSIPAKSYNARRFEVCAVTTVIVSVWLSGSNSGVEDSPHFRAVCQSLLNRNSSVTYTVIVLYELFWHTVGCLSFLPLSTRSSETYLIPTLMNPYPVEPDSWRATSSRHCIIESSSWVLQYIRLFCICFQHNSSMLNINHMLVKDT